MRIPTILSEQSIPYGSTGPQSSPESFGMPTARAAAGLSRSLANGADVVAQLATNKYRKEQIRDHDWMNESLIQEREHLVTWLHENRQDQDLAYKFQEYTRTREKEYLGAAPSPEAAKSFQQRFRQDNLSLYSAALNTQANTRVSNIITNVEEEAKAITNTWRTARSIPGLDAGALVQEDISKVYEFLDGLSDITPAVAARLKSHVAEEAIYATMSQDPELARSILDRSPIDEQKRHQLLTRIDNAADMKLDGVRLQFDQSVKDNLSALVAGNKNWEKIPMSSFTLVYPDEKGERLFNEYDDKVQIQLRSNQLTTELAPLNISAQRRRFNDLMSNVSTENELKALALVSQSITSNERLMTESPATYLSMHNPVVRAALERGETTNDYSEYHALLTKYQGAPPPGVKDKDSYLGLAPAEFQIIGTGQAEDWATRINSSSPGQVLELIDQADKQFNSEDAIGLFWQQMASLPGSKRVQLKWQLAHLNKDEPFIKDFIVAQQSAKSFEKLTEEENTDLLSAFRGNPLWNAFADGLIGDSAQRADDMAEFQDAIINYARYLLVSPTSGIRKHKSAVNKAIGDVIGSRLSVSQVNGWNTWIYNRRADGTIRQQDEVNMLGRQMETMLNLLPFKEIDLNDQTGMPHWPALDMLNTDEQKERALGDELRKNGRWVTDPDLRGATLYTLGDRGPFVVRDKGGKAISVRFDDLEAILNFQRGRDPKNFSNKATGFSGMVNLFNPLSPYNIANLIYGPRDMKTLGLQETSGLGLSSVGLYIGSRNQIFTTNLPTAGRREIKK